jgi:ABC-2 type transport system ATP-binding protein
MKKFALRNSSMEEVKAIESQAIARAVRIGQTKNVMVIRVLIEKTIEEEGKLLVYLKQDIPAQELNSYLFEQKIVLEHLVKRKNSLEEQFLELTNNK